MFAYDNSQNHHAIAPDALRASRLNLSNGGKRVELMRPGWFYKDGINVQQDMQFIDPAVSTVRVQKGLKAILMERQLWNGSLNLASARILLSQQQDFMETREWLEETVTSNGSMIIYYPKFHCEFN